MLNHISTLQTIYSLHESTKLKSTTSTCEEISRDQHDVMGLSRKVVQVKQVIQLSSLLITKEKTDDEFIVEITVLIIRRFLFCKLQLCGNLTIIVKFSIFFILSLLFL